MALPTVEQVKAAYAAHPEIKPCHGGWGNEFGAETFCCPLSVVALHEHGVQLWGVEKIRKIYIAAHLFDCRSDQIRGFIAGVDNDFTPESDGEDPESAALGQRVRAAVFGG